MKVNYATTKNMNKHKYYEINKNLCAFFNLMIKI